MSNYGQGVAARLFASPLGLALLVLAVLVELIVPGMAARYAPDGKQELFRLIARIVGAGLMLLACVLIIYAET